MPVTDPQPLIDLLTPGLNWTISKYGPGVGGWLMWHRGLWLRLHKDGYNTGTLIATEEEVESNEYKDLFSGRVKDSILDILTYPPQLVQVPLEPTERMIDACHKATVFNDNGLTTKDYLDQPSIAWRAMIGAWEAEQLKKK